MNFIKAEGEEISILLEIISERFQSKLLNELIITDKYSREFNANYFNNSASITVNNKRYPNITFGFISTTIAELLEGLNLMAEDILSRVEPRTQSVSFRQPTHITQINGRYHTTCRLAIIDLF